MFAFSPVGDLKFYTLLPGVCIPSNMGGVIDTQRCCSFNSKAFCIRVILLGVETLWVSTASVKQHFMCFPRFGGLGQRFFVLVFQMCLVSKCELYATHCLLDSFQQVVFFTWQWCVHAVVLFMLIIACLIVFNKQCASHNSDVFILLHCLSLCWCLKCCSMLAATHGGIYKPGWSCQ